MLPSPQDRNVRIDNYWHKTLPGQFQPLKNRGVLNSQGMVGKMRNLLHASRLFLADGIPRMGRTTEHSEQTGLVHLKISVGTFRERRGSFFRS